MEGQCKQAKPTSEVDERAQQDDKEHGQGTATWLAIMQAVGRIGRDIGKALCTGTTRPVFAAGPWQGECFLYGHDGICSMNDVVTNNHSLRHQHLVLPGPFAQVFRSLSVGQSLHATRQTAELQLQQ